MRRNNATRLTRSAIACTHASPRDTEYCCRSSGGLGYKHIKQPKAYGHAGRVCSAVFRKATDIVHGCSSRSCYIRKWTPLSRILLLASRNACKHRRECVIRIKRKLELTWNETSCQDFSKNPPGQWRRQMQVIGARIT